MGFCNNWEMVVWGTARGASWHVAGRGVEMADLLCGGTVILI